MIRLAANLSTMFTEVPLRERFGRAARAGFAAVEMMFPYELPAGAIAAELRACRLEMVLFNAPPGDWAAGDRGIAALPDRVTECRDGIMQALDYARALGCRRIHVMAGITNRHDPAARRQTFHDNLRFAAEAAAADGIDILIEPINSRVDMPGYHLDRSAAAAEVIAAVGLSNLQLQYDAYHMQIMEGDLARTIERLLPLIGHVQIADNPGRHEPGTGEINIPWLLGTLDRLGYAGHVGCEYRPAGATEEGLGWAAPYLGR